MTCLIEEILEVQVDAPCVWRRKKLWIILLYIIGGFLRFGIYLSRLWGLVGFTSNVTDVVVAYRRRMKKSWVLEVWNMIPLAIWWATWKERNRRIFEDKILSFKDFKLYFLRLYS